MNEVQEQAETPQDSTVIDEDVSGGPAPAHKEPETRDDAISKALDEAEAKTKEPAANGDAEESEGGEPVKPAKADKADKDDKDATEGDEGEQDEEGEDQAAEPKQPKPKKPQRGTITQAEQLQEA